MNDVRNFGATGDGKTDDTAAIRHAVANSIGVLRFSTGTYRITETIEIPLAKRGPSAITGDEGTSRVIMAGPGPAFRIVGNHAGTGDPASVKPSVWDREHMPTIRNLVVEGEHPEADGIELTGTMQALIEGVLVRRVRHGIAACRRINVSSCQFTDGVPFGIDAGDCEGVLITGCTVAEPRPQKLAKGSIRFSGQGSGNRIALCNLDRKPDHGPESGLEAE